MSGICGWFTGPGGTAMDPDAIGQVTRRLARFDNAEVRAVSAKFGAAGVAVARGDCADTFSREGKLVAVWGRAMLGSDDVPSVDRASSGSNASSGGEPIGAARIAELHDRRGADLFALLTGSYVIAILDARRDEVLLAVDRMGTRALGYRMDRGTLLFGSRLDVHESAVFMGNACGTSVATTAPAVDSQAIFDYVYHHMIPAPASIHAGSRRLQPGEYVSLRQGRLTTARHWQMRFVENESRPVAELKEEFLGIVRDSVRRAAVASGSSASDASGNSGDGSGNGTDRSGSGNGTDRSGNGTDRSGNGTDRSGAVGAFLSGGTDSSTIAGFLGEVTGEPARTYSIGFDAQGYDEMEYARIASKHFGTRHHEYYVTPGDVVNAIPLIAAVHDQPFGNSSAVPAYYCAKLAREDGVDTILGGDGGDELFGGNERYAKQHLYSLYSDLPHSMRRLIEPVAFTLPEVGVFGKAQRYMRHAMQPMPARYENYNLLERLGAANVFTSDFLAGVDREGPRASMEHLYAASGAGSLINRMLALDFKYTLADNDLPKVNGSCELAGITARFPLLDDALVDFASRLEPRMKLNGTRLRYFFKEALRGFLPDAIINKTKHGFGLPFGPWMNTHPKLRAIAMDSLADLKQRRIVRPAFIDELTSERVRDHAGYYGSMVWVLMMLEQWFRQHPGATVRDAPTAVVDDAAQEPALTRVPAGVMEQ